MRRTNSQLEPEIKAASVMRIGRAIVLRLRRLTRLGDVVASRDHHPNEPNGTIVGDRVEVVAIPGKHPTNTHPSG